MKTRWKELSWKELGWKDLEVKGVAKPAELCAAGYIVLTSESGDEIELSRQDLFDLHTALIQWQKEWGDS